MNKLYGAFHFPIDILKGFFPLFIGGIFLSGCAMNYASLPKRASSPLTHATENIADEIALLEESAKITAEPQLKSKTLLKLAILYSHHKNPMPNYTDALSKLQEYISMAPGNKPNSDHYYLLSLLKKIQELSIEYEASIKGYKEKNRGDPSWWVCNASEWASFVTSRGDKQGTCQSSWTSQRGGGPKLGKRRASKWG